MAALIIAIFPQNSSRGNWEEQQDRTDPNSRFELARKPAWLLAFRQFGLPKWKHDFESFSLRPLRYVSISIIQAFIISKFRRKVNWFIKNVLIISAGVTAPLRLTGCPAQLTGFRLAAHPKAPAVRRPADRQAARQADGSQG